MFSSYRLYIQFSTLDISFYCLHLDKPTFKKTQVYCQKESNILKEAKEDEKDVALSFLNLSENVRLQKSHSSKSRKELEDESISVAEILISLADRNTDNTNHNVSPISNTIDGSTANMKIVEVLLVVPLTQPMRTAVNFPQK